MAGWKTTVRRRGGVEKARHDTLEAAIAAVEARLDELAAAEPRRGERALVRGIAASEVVTARGELHGPGGRAGIDLHADRTTTAWTGVVRRRRIEPAPGETAYEALARVLAG
jgi:hypothetical protein